MCCLFGLIDISRQMSEIQKRRLISCLAEASEIRGKDATGYACNTGGRLYIKKAPVPAHRMKFRIPKDACVIMGHTRMTTQGSAARNYNNHPFTGKAADGQFALAHNGVLSNDDLLRSIHDLPRSRIETDSFVAVQLIEKRNSLDFNAIRFMAEEVKGTFCFTLLDQEDRLYIIKGNNPLCLYRFREGFYAYASTREILEEGLEQAGYRGHPYEEIPIQSGEILMIDPQGSITRERFQPPVAYSHTHMYSFYDREDEISAEYRNYMMNFAESLGVPRRELEWLASFGYPDDELEECVYDNAYRKSCLEFTGYYDEMEEEYESFADQPWRCAAGA